MRRLQASVMSPLGRRELLRAMGVGAFAATIAPWLASCGRDGSTPGGVDSRVALYLWSDYLADSTIPGFERELGVRASLDTYESNEEMLAKLLAGATGYDVVSPSSYMFPALLANDLLAPLSPELLGNRSGIGGPFASPGWDPEGRHGVPWQWGTTGIAFRADLLPERVDSWAVFLDPRYRGKMTMLDDLREVIGAFLRLRGHSLNSVVPAELAQAKAVAIAAKKNLKAYVSATVKPQLIAGDVWIAQLWSGDAAQAKAEQPGIEFVVPKEGSSIFVDTLAILKAAPHPRAAHEFINYVLRPEVAGAIADKTGYGTTNAAGVPLTAAKLQYPSEQELSRLEYQRDLASDGEAWDRIWTEIKAA